MCCPVPFEDSPDEEVGSRQPDLTTPRELPDSSSTTARKQLDLVIRVLGGPRQAVVGLDGRR